MAAQGDQRMRRPNGTAEQQRADRKQQGDPEDLAFGFHKQFPFQMQISKTSVWGEGSEGFRQRLSLGQSILQERFVIDFPHILHGRADKVVFSNAEEGAQGAPVLAAAVGFQ